MRGMYCVGFGEPARRCAVRAIESFKRHMPGVEVAFAGVQRLGPEDVFIKTPDSDIGGRRAKLLAYRNTPERWKSVLYLDADTETVADVGFLYRVVEDGWELAICRNPAHYHTVRRMERPDNKVEVAETLSVLGSDELIQYNGGVFAFHRSERVQKFFDTWLAEWERWGARDQAALLRALWAVPLRVYLLGSEWNTVTRYLPREASAGILHYPTEARRWEGSVHGRIDSDAAWEKVSR